MGYPAAGTGGRGRGDVEPAPAGSPARGSGARTAELPRPRPADPTRTSTAGRRATGSVNSPRPPGRPTGRRFPLRLTVALLLTVGAVVLLGATDDTSEPSPSAGADCASRAPVADLSPVQSRNARIITGVAIQRDLGQEAAAIAVAAALAETGLINFANDGTSELYASEINRPLSDVERAVARRSLDYPHDEVGNNLDSIGLFQQRPTTGWGAPERLIDPASAAGLFYDRLLKIPDWQSGVPWQTAQQVQSSPSADGGIYEQSYERAVTVVQALWSQPPCT